MAVSIAVLAAAGLPGFPTLFDVPLLAAGDDGPLRLLLVRLLVIILAARAGAAVARRFGQPSVVGEIVAGLALGPSGLGRLAPGLSAAVFDPAEGPGDPALVALSQIGLVLLLFLVGLEFDFSHIRRHARLAAAISTAGIVTPFVLGLGLGGLMVPRLPALGADATTDPRSFCLFLGTAMSITAIPVLGRLLVEMGLHRSLLGAAVIAAAACDDAAGWTMLAAVSAIAKGEFHPASIVRMIAGTLTLAACCLLILRPLLRPWLEKALGAAGGPTGARLPPGPLSLLLATLFAAAIAASLVGPFAIFGAFLLGASLSDTPRLREAVSSQLGPTLDVILLPVFFTYTGLRADLGTLGSVEALGWAAAVMAVAVAGKWGGCGLAARGCGMPAAEANAVGLLMNTRGLMELVVCNVGLDLGVIPRSVYCMLVLMAVGTTLMTAPLAARALADMPHAPLLASRGFLGGRPRSGRD
jgi:Kef-type K+ transport system membrane component KefB